MDPETMKDELQKLALAWRLKATRIQEKYRNAIPEQVQVAVTVYETCAEEIEELITRL
jgi:hypothetical protein